MKTLLLAAMLQSSPATVPLTLPTGDYEAALRCSNAWLRDNMTDSLPSVELISQVTWFISLAAKLQPAGQDFITRSKELMAQQMSKVGSLAVADAHVLAAQCRTRFPLAAKTMVTLPSDPLRRDAICGMTSAVISGMAGNRDGKTGGNEAAEPKRVMAAYLGRVTDDRVKPMGTDKDTYLVSQIAASVDFGNYFAIERTCAAAL